MDPTKNTVPLLLPVCHFTTTNCPVGSVQAGDTTAEVVATQSGCAAEDNADEDLPVRFEALLCRMHCFNGGGNSRMSFYNPLHTSLIAEMHSS